MLDDHRDPGPAGAFPEKAQLVLLLSVFSVFFFMTDTLGLFGDAARDYILVAAVVAAVPVSYIVKWQMIKSGGQDKLVDFISLAFGWANCVLSALQFTWTHDHSEEEPGTNNLRLNFFGDPFDGFVFRAHVTAALLSSAIVIGRENGRSVLRRQVTKRF